MIKAYALNKNGKIELTLEELQKLIDEAVEEGKRLVGWPGIVYCDMVQTRPVDVTPKWGDTPPFTSPLTCQTGTATGTTKDGVKVTMSAEDAYKTLCGNGLRAGATEE